MDKVQKAIIRSSQKWGDEQDKKMVITMENKEILANAIDKAIANGWDAGRVITTNPEILDEAIDMGGFISIIFSHSFLQAFFDKDVYVHWDECNPNLEDLLSYKDIPQGEIHLIYLTPQGDYHWYQPIWAYHAQVMILETEPLKYLEKFL